MKNMHAVHLPSVDLNLLVALDALLVEQSVTRAAKRLGLSQSAMSHALSRLRDLIGDPILVRTQMRMTPTPRAEALAASVRQALATIQKALAGEEAFDPKTAKRTFTLAMSDYAELVLLPPLLKRLAKEAPGVDLWVLPAPDETTDALARGAVDLMIAPMRSRASGLSSEVLFEDRFVCVVRKGHPLTKKRMTIARFCEASHLLIAPRGLRGSFVDDALEAMGRTRRVAVAVPHFLVAPHLVASSDLLLTLASRVARVFGAVLKLHELRAPVELPTFSISQIWHARAAEDSGLAWLRGALQEVSREQGV